MWQPGSPLPSTNGTSLEQKDYSDYDIFESSLEDNVTSSELRSSSSSEDPENQAEIIRMKVLEMNKIYKDRQKILECRKKDQLFSRHDKN